jgi:hypothetical protein
VTAVAENQQMERRAKSALTFGIKQGIYMKLSRHNVEQMARGYLMYELAKRGYNVQITDGRFPVVDILVVSPSGKHFGIDVKGQRTKNFWRFNEREPRRYLFYGFVYVPESDTPRVFIMDSGTTMKLWNDYKAKTKKRGSAKHNIWGLNWTTPHAYENRFDLLPK